MSPYDTIVAQTLAAMGTASFEWSAVPGQMTEAGEEFSYPAGYSHAPSPLKALGIEPNCELCGHGIKNCYWLQNDTRKWLLMVGSECVTHFGEGKSGEQIAKEHQRANLRQQLRDVRTLAKLAQNPTPEICRGITREQATQLYTAGLRLQALVRGYIPDATPAFHQSKVASDAKVASWHRTRGPKAAPLIETIKRMAGVK